MIDTIARGMAGSTKQLIPGDASKDNQLVTKEYVDNIAGGRGRFLSLWDATEGKAVTDPLENPFYYNTGDYFIVKKVAITQDEKNYKPNGAYYDKDNPLSIEELERVNVDDTYYYDGITWKLQVNTERVVDFEYIGGNPMDNTQLAMIFNSKQDELISGTNIKTINGEEILGEGNISVRTYQAMPEEWLACTTMEDFITTMWDTEGVVQGMAYVGTCDFEPMPVMGEVVVEIISEGIALFKLNSSDTPPYNWYYNTWSEDFTWKEQSDMRYGYFNEGVMYKDPEFIEILSLEPYILCIDELTQNIYYAANDEDYNYYWKMIGSSTDKENIANKVTVLSSSSTDTQYPSAKCVYDELQVKSDKTNIETSSETEAQILQPLNNTEYRFSVEMISLELGIPISHQDDHIFSVVFNSGSAATDIVYSDTIIWTGDDLTSGKFVPKTNRRYTIVVWYDGVWNGVVRGVDYELS